MGEEPWRAERNYQGLICHMSILSGLLFGKAHSVSWHISVLMHRTGPES